MALLDDLISYWTLNEATSTRSDSHSTNHLTPEGTAPTGAAGLIGNATVFPDSGGLDYTGAALNLTTTDSFSVAVWVYPTSLVDDYPTIVNQLSSGDRKLYLLTLPTTRELVMYNHFNSGSFLTLNTWQHIVYTFASGGVNTGTERFYVNGAQVATRTGAVPAPTTGGLNVGWDDLSGGQHSWIGRLDELAIWRRALTAPEVVQLYGAGAGLAYPLAVAQTVFTLGPAGATIDLADIDTHHVLAQGLRFEQTRQRTLPALSGRDAVRLAYSQATALTIGVLVGVTGADHDTFLTNWNEIIAQLRLARAYALDGLGAPVEFTVQWANAAAPLAYDVLDGEFPPPPALTNPVVASGQFYDAVLTLLCQPYGRTATAATASSGTLTNDTTGWTPADVPGDTHAPARLRVQNKSAAAVGLVRAATRSRGTPANFLFPILAGAASPSGYTLTPGTQAGKVAIRLSFRARVTAGTGTFWVIWRSGAGVNYRIGPLVSTASVSYVTHTRTHAVNPATGSAFTLAELNAGQWGFEQEGATATRITQLYGTLVYLDRDLVEQTENRLPNANGAAVAWTVTGVANTYDALNDPVGTPDDDTTYISSTTDAQVALVALDDFTTDIAGTATGLRAGATELVYNGGMDGTFVENAPVGWYATGSGGSAVTGVVGQGVRVTAANTVVQRIPVLASTTYRVQGYGRYVSGSSNAMLTATPDVGTAANAQTVAASFTALSFTVTTGVGATTLALTLSSQTLGAPDIVEFDSVSLVPESLVSTTAVEVVRVTIATNLSDQYGAYRVMVRAQGTGGDTLFLKWGGATGAMIANESVALATSSTVQIVDLGRMNIPEQEPPRDTAIASFVFSIWRGATGGSIDLDTIELWPAENYVELEASTAIVGVDQYAAIDSLARSPTAYLADSSGNRVQTLAHVGSPPELTVGTSRVLARVSRARTDDRRADGLALDLRYYARYELGSG